MNTERGHVPFDLPNNMFPLQVFEATVQSDIIHGVVIALCQHKLVFGIWCGRLGGPPIQQEWVNRLHGGRKFRKLTSTSLVRRHESPSPDVRLVYPLRESCTQ